MPTREQTYKAQLQALGVYDPAFDPMIQDLAQMDRRWQRAKKEWAATAPPGGKPSFLDPRYQALTQIERDRRALRESMGLTPKGLRRLRGAAEPPAQEDLIAAKLTAIAERVSAYSMPDLSKLDIPAETAESMPGGGPCGDMPLSEYLEAADA